MTKRALTFAEFQATGRSTDDLRAVFPDDFRDSPEAVAGRVYCEDPQAQDGPMVYLFANDSDEQRARGPWLCEIGNFAQYGELAQAEAALYHFYVTELGVEHSARAYLLDAAPASEFWRLEPDTEASLVTLLESFCSFHGIEPRCAYELTYEVTDADQLRWLHSFCERWDETVG